MRLLIQAIWCFLLLGTVWSVKPSASASVDAGMRLTLDNTFLKTTAKTLLPKIFKMLADSIRAPNSYNFAFSYWPLLLNVTLKDFQTTRFQQNGPHATFEAVPRNQAFFVRLPLIQNWDIHFDYLYRDRFMDNVTGQGLVHIENFCFSIEFSIFKQFGTPYLSVLALNLELGNSALSFTNPPPLFQWLAYFVNDLKPLVTFVVNYMLRSVLNLGLRFVPLSMTVPVMGNYGIDMSPMDALTMDALTSTLFLRAEIFNQVKNIRGSYARPVDLHSIPNTKPSSVELLLNVQPFASLFSSLEKSGDMHITLQDKDVFNITGFLHLRTSDFRYYIPGLMKFGDVPMNLSLSVYGAIPNLTFSPPDKLLLAGGIQVDFLVPKVGSAIKLGLTGELALQARIDQPQKNLTAKLINVGIKELVVVGKPLIDPPPVDAMKKEFNTLFKFIVNGVNIFAFDKPIHIPDSLPLGFTTLLIPSASMRILSGVLGAAATLNFTS